MHARAAPEPWLRRGTRVPRPPWGPRPSLALSAPWREWQREGEVENRFPRFPAPPGLAAELWTRGARTSAPRAGGERALSPSRGAAVPSVFHRAATCRRMPRAARAGTGYSAELRVRRSRLSASVLQRSGTAPAGRGPATYLLLGVSRGSQPPRRVFANLKLFFCNVAGQRPLSLAHSTSEPKDFDRKLSLSYSVSVSFTVPFYQGQSSGKCGHRPPPSLSVPSATEGASLRRFPRIVRTAEAHFPVEQTSQTRRPEWTWQSANHPSPQKNVF
ncbi:uncharacterized protein LOC118501101 isoform X1 [Phyllostomus discolor]|uniref:Uncharacterized protein LOC118501101 isoform X1 n=1 Tax=Phyllostomus discolor TaxID=89673 RepID=A0A7E6DY15_9CHIR|nr:uncharacterized protein LOC118501101 isoform X1 [Phyllostomus discolor]